MLHERMTRRQAAILLAVPPVAYALWKLNPPEWASRQLDREISQWIPDLPPLVAPEALGGQSIQTAQKIQFASINTNACYGVGVVTDAAAGSQSFAKIYSNNGRVFAAGYDGISYAYDPGTRSFAVDSSDSQPYTFTNLSTPSDELGLLEKKCFDTYTDVQHGTWFLNHVGYVFDPSIWPDTAFPVAEGLTDNPTFVGVNRFLREPNYINEEKHTYLITQKGYVLDYLHAWGVIKAYEQISSQVNRKSPVITVSGFYPGMGFEYEVLSADADRRAIVNGIALHYATYSEYMQQIVANLTPRLPDAPVGLNFEDVYTNNFMTYHTINVAHANPSLSGTKNFRETVIRQALSGVIAQSGDGFQNRPLPLGIYPNIFVTLSGNGAKDNSLPTLQSPAGLENVDFRLKSIQPVESTYKKVLSKFL